MKKEFIPYEQAVALRELGFKESCFFNYYKRVDGKIIQSTQNNYSFRAGVPLYQQAFRWFREKYGLHTVINVGIPHDNIAHSKKIQYFFNVVKCGVHHKGMFRSTFYTTYGEAELECLNKLIEIVKNK